MSGPWGQSQRIHAGTSGGGARPALTGVSGLSQRIYTSTTGGPRPALSGVSGLSQRIRAPGGIVGCFDRTVWGGPALALYGSWYTWWPYPAPDGGWASGEPQYPPPGYDVPHWVLALDDHWYNWLSPFGVLDVGYIASAGTKWNGYGGYSPFGVETIAELAYDSRYWEDIGPGYLVNPFSSSTIYRGLPLDADIAIRVEVYARGRGDNNTTAFPVPWEIVQSPDDLWPDGDENGYSGEVLASGTQLGDYYFTAGDDPAPDPTVVDFVAHTNSEGVLQLSIRIPGVDAVLHEMGPLWVGPFLPAQQGVGVLFNNLTSEDVLQGGGAVPLAEAPCALGPRLWARATEQFEPLIPSDTELIWTDDPLPPPVSRTERRDASPLQYPFTLGLTGNMGEVEMVEATDGITGGYTVVRAIGCKPAGDWPYGGVATSYYGAGSGVVTSNAGVGFVMPGPGSGNGSKWTATGSGIEVEALIPATAATYDIVWAFSVSGTGTFELRVWSAETEDTTAIDSVSGVAYAQRTVAYPLKPGDVVTVWCTSGSNGHNMALRYVRIRVKG